MDCRIFLLIACIAVLKAVALPNLPLHKNPVKRQAAPSYAANLCNHPPGLLGRLEGQAYNVGHPDICNAFFRCGPHLTIYPQCFFCPNGTMHPLGEFSCLALAKEVLNSACEGRKMVSDADQVHYLTEGLCTIYNLRGVVG